MIRQDARVLVVEPGAAHRGFPQCARFIDTQVDAVVAGPVGHRSILVVGYASVPPDRTACPPRAPESACRFRNETSGLITGPAVRLVETPSALSRAKAPRALK
jgi:hypothetical protein